jgi:ribonuclease T1
VILLIVGWYGDHAGADPVLLEQQASVEPAASSNDRRVEGVPVTAYEVLAAIQQNRGKPLPGYVGGRTFMNRERRLPSGRYREYDIHPLVPGRNRGAERIVVDQRSGKAYYTGDHYRTFIPMH